MKKILFSIFVLSVFCHTANAKIWLADNNTCIIDDNGYNRGWFCGSSDATECGGKKVTGSNRKKYELEHGAKFEHDKAPVKAWQQLNESNKTSNKNFYCCIPDGKSAGTWVASDNPQFSTSIEDYVLFAHGSCKYTKTTDACGNVTTSDPCNNPTTCDNGYELKNNKCTKIETKSDTTTDTGNDSKSNNDDNNSNNGDNNNSNNDSNNNNNNNDNNNSNSGDNSGGNNYKSTPKPGKTYLSYPAGALQVCWRCGHNQSLFKSCVEVMSTTPAERSKHPEYGTVKSECKTGI